jgi:chaperonin GroES
MTAKIKPLGSRILVQRHEVKVSKGGILLPDAAKQKPKQGIVLAIGPGKIDEQGRKIPMDVKVGDEVLFSSFGGSEYTMDDQEYLILAEEDVLAVFN